MAGAVDWAVAQRVATRVAGREPFSQSYHYDSLEPDFAAATTQAEELVAAETGLVSLAGPARARVTDRAGWVSANVASFQRLLRPIIDKLGDRIEDNPLSPLAKKFAGVEVGMMLGWMSTRVLGQYDLLIIEEENPHEQDIVYYVGPNILSLEKQFAFPPREFRLWLALHEVTHRAQFTGIPWLRPHVLGLVDELLASVDPDPQRLFAAINEVLEKFDDRVGSGFAAPLTTRLAGAELGMVLGWMSGRVLGQYDLLVIEEEDPGDQDLVYYVGPNVLALEKQFAFPPEQFRLWLALHEVTHRAQFTGVPWLREHFIGLVHDTLGAVDPDPKRLLDGVNRMADAVRSGQNPLADGGLVNLVAGPEQRAILDQVSGMMSLLEGHGDVTMDRAGQGLVPSADRFGRVLRERRDAAKGLSRLVQQLIGLEAKLNQYAQGEAFIADVERAGGTTLLSRAWEEPGNLPSLIEIREPHRWIERMGAALPAAG